MKEYNVDGVRPAQMECIEWVERLNTNQRTKHTTTSISCIHWMVNLHVNCINVMFISYVLRLDFSFVSFLLLWVFLTSSRVSFVYPLHVVDSVFLIFSFLVFFLWTKRITKCRHTMKHNQSFGKFFFSYIFWMAMSRDLTHATISTTCCNVCTYTHALYSYATYRMTSFSWQETFAEHLHSIWI